MSTADDHLKDAIAMLALEAETERRTLAGSRLRVSHRAEDDHHPLTTVTHQESDQEFNARWRIPPDELKARQAHARQLIADRDREASG